MVFTATPNVLYIEPRVKSQYTVHLDYLPMGQVCYPNRALDLPPNVSVEFPLNPFMKPIPITVTYDPSQSDAKASGKYTARIEMLMEHNPTNHINLTFCFQPEQKEEEEEKPTSSLLECGICYQEFDEVEHTPKMLSCGHTFCWDCIANIQSAHNTPTMFGRPSYSCPLDRMDINQPASTLPKNRLVLDLLEEKKKQERKKGLLAPQIVEDPDVPCYENDRHESSVYCENCKESFCSSCYGSVHSSKMLSKHNFIPVTDRPLNIPMCPVHQQLSAQFVCQDEVCQSLSCALCLGHHETHDWKPLQAQITENIDYLESVVNKLILAECSIENQIYKNEKCAISFNPHGEGIQKLMEEIDQNFEKKRKDARDKLLTWAYDKQRDLTIKKSDSERILEDLQKIRKKAEQTLKRKTELHMDLSQFPALDSEIFVSKKDSDHYFHLDEHDFSPDMLKKPSSPIVLDESPCPSPSPSPELLEPPRKTLKRERTPLIEDRLYKMVTDMDGDGEVVDVEL